MSRFQAAAIFACIISLASYPSNVTNFPFEPRLLLGSLQIPAATPFAASDDVKATSTYMDAGHPPSHPYCLDVACADAIETVSRHSPLQGPLPLGRLLRQEKPQFESATQSSAQHGPVVIRAQDEVDLAHAISAATGPDLTIILLPASITLTQSLPSCVSGPLQLISAGSSTLIRCASNTSAFTALVVLAESFSMSGLTWAGCGGVISLSGASQVTISDCSFHGNGLPTNVTVSFADLYTLALGATSSLCCV